MTDKDTGSTAGHGKSPPASPPSKDRLTDLPVELVERMFHSAGREWPRGPICRALLPLQRRLYTSFRFGRRHPFIRWDMQRENPRHEPYFRSVIPLLAGLRYLDICGLPRPLALLATLPSPSSLYNLKFTYDGTEDVGPDSSEGLGDNTPVDELEGATNASDPTSVFARLSNLETLFIEGKGHVSDSYITALCPTPLEQLRIEETGISAAALLSLIEGPAELEHLARLTLDTVFGEFGERWHDCEGSSSRFEEGWVLPEWPDDFSRDDYFEIALAASRVGIELEGTVVEALQVEERYEKECELRDSWEKDIRRNKERYDEFCSHSYDEEGQGEEDDHDNVHEW
ncbi:hypothetical protein JCM10207_004325 [Rhodosporidiobolus poonsookiae]